MQFATEQEAFWAGNFGAEYTERNQGDLLRQANEAYFQRALHNTMEIRSVIEFGCNRGMNLPALAKAIPAVGATDGE